MIPPDEIVINGLEFYAYHGASDEEQQVGHRYTIDARLEVDTHRAGDTDRLGDTVSYSRAARRMVEVGTQEQFRLLEALGARIAAVVLSEFPLVQTIHLRLLKVSPPMNAIVASVGVAITRSRE